MPRIGLSSRASRTLRRLAISSTRSLENAASAEFVTTRLASVARIWRSASLRCCGVIFTEVMSARGTAAGVVAAVAAAARVLGVAAAVGDIAAAAKAGTLPEGEAAAEVFGCDIVTER